MRARALAVFGTGSDVGKSLITAGLCRLWARAGWSVAPFKAQNMSLNAYVTSDGGEIGRAQAVQAWACGLDPHVDMNPILLKPETDCRSQVIVHGTPLAAYEAHRYYADLAPLWEAVTASYARLAAQHDRIVIEGAGSAAEVNLRARDLVNWRMAAHADADVVLVADIDRGGVFAQVVGTVDLLLPEERARLVGVIINKFRGDRALFEDGVRFLEARTGVPVLGVVPYLRDCWLEDEDGLPDRSKRATAFRADAVNIAVVLLPRMSNATDFVALETESDVVLRYARTVRDLEGADVVVLPGTKSTAADLTDLRERGVPAALARHLAAGREVVGICGGYQMLGTRLKDPLGVESAGETPGLGWLDMTTEWQVAKRCRRVTGRPVGLAGLEAEPIAGYEIHAGRTTVAGSPGFLVVPEKRGGEARPPAIPEPAGAVGHDGLVWGTSVHGVFDAPGFRRAWLNRVRRRKQLPSWEPPHGRSAAALLEAGLARWADHLDQHLDRGGLEGKWLGEEGA